MSVTYNNAAMPHTAADDMDRALFDWKASLSTLDQDLKDKERIEALIYDLYRNNDLFRGLIDKDIDTIVGSKMILQCKPDYEALGATAAQAKTWSRFCEQEWTKYADSPENWISADRSMDFTQLCRAATKQYKFSGEIVTAREWRTSGTVYKTCFNLVSSNRLKNPESAPSNFTDEGKTRGVCHGIEFDRYGAAVKYHISSFSRGADSNTAFAADGKVKTQSKSYPKYNRIGIQQIFHIYEPLKPEYPRGISRATCVIKKIKQWDRFNQADLEKAIIASSYALAITSPLGPEDVAAMLSGANEHKPTGGGFGGAAMGADTVSMPAAIKKKYDELLVEFSTRYTDLAGGGRYIHLFNDESAEMLQPHSNMGASENFSRTHARSIANGLGMSYELGAGDFQGISFSGGQLSLGIYEHSANIIRKLYIHKFAKLCFRAWLDEAMDRGTIPLLNDRPYRQNKECYARCEFSGAKRVHVDPVKNARATSLNLQNGVTSRTESVNANGGDIEQVVRDRANEAALILEAVRQVATEKGLALTPAAEMSIVIDVIATKQVDTPENLTGENDENDQQN